MVQRIWDEAGPLTGLVNNAAGNFISPTKDLTPNGFNAIANIVFHGSFYVTHAVGKRWIEGKHKGSVISILVTWVHTGSPYVVPSAMSKAGLHVMTKSLAVEWGRYGIRLNAIAPGPFPTEGASKRLPAGRQLRGRRQPPQPARRIGDMPELQNLATFLMADGCEWLTGETIAVDGAGLSRQRRQFLRIAQVGATPSGKRRARRSRRQSARDKAPSAGDGSGRGIMSGAGKMHSYKLTQFKAPLTRGHRGAPGPAGDAGPSSRQGLRGLP